MSSINFSLICHILADFLVYLLVCFQMYYFHENPLKKAGKGVTDGQLAKFLRLQFLVDYVKVMYNIFARFQRNFIVLSSIM